MSLPQALALSVAQLGDRAVLRVLAKTVLVTLAIFAGLALLLGTLVAPWLARMSGQDSTLFVVLGTLLGIVAAWLLFRIVALAVIQLFADEVVAAVESRHYPDTTPRKLGLREEAANGLKGALRAIIVNAIAAPFAIALLVTGVGTALLFWAVNAWLLGRELTDMVWLRLRDPDDPGQPVGAGTRFLLGGIIAALLLVPFANLFAPVLGAAAATHLVHGARKRTAP